MSTNTHQFENASATLGETYQEKRHRLLPSPVLDSTLHDALIQASIADAERLGKIELLPAALPPALFNGVFSLAQYQTPFKAQNDRGTCWAFAGVAALEAAYNRKFGIVVDASEEYTFHMGKAFALGVDANGFALPIENNSSLTGFQGSGDIVKKLTECAIPGEDSAPYVQSQRGLLDILTTLGYSGIPALQFQEDFDALEYCEQHIPLLSRVNARYRAADWGTLGANPSITALENTLLSNREVVCDVQHLTSPIGGHVLLLVGFDRNRQVFQAKNSWGENKFIEISYTNDPNWQIKSGFFIKDVVDSTFVQGEACWVGNWWLNFVGKTGRLLIRRSEDLGNAGQPTKLGTLYLDGNKLDVNGSFFNNGMSVHLFIAPSPAPTKPGSTSGTAIDAHLNLSDIYNADGSDPSVTLSRFATRFAALWQPSDGHPWVARHGIDSATYQNLVNDLGPQGYRPLHICGYSEGRDARFATVWSKVDGPPWVARHNLTSAEYQSAFDALASVGYRLISLSGYAIDGQARYAGIWEQRSGPDWIAHHGLTRAQYQQTFIDLPAQGYVPVQVGGYRVNVDVLFTALWERIENVQWEAHHAMTTLEYQKKFDQMLAAGNRLVWVNGYSDTGIARYAAIWYQGQSGAWQARHGMDSAHYQQAFDQFATQGFRPVQISGYGDGFNVA
jgi:Polyglycine hydrolase-like, structural repeat